MVFGVIDILVQFSQNLLYPLLPLPEILTKPLVSNVYVDISFIAILIAVIVISKFLITRRLLIALAVSIIFSIVVGGVYFALAVLAVQIPLTVIWKFFVFGKKKDELGAGMEKEMKGRKGKEADMNMDFGADIGGTDEGLGLPEAEGMNMPKSAEVVPGMPDVSPKKAKLCPYCGNELRYINQYQRYYCDYCKQYR